MLHTVETKEQKHAALMERLQYQVYLARSAGDEGRALGVEAQIFSIESGRMLEQGDYRASVKFDRLAKEKRLAALDQHFVLDDKYIGDIQNRRRNAYS